MHLPPVNSVILRDEPFLKYLRMSRFLFPPYLKAGDRVAITCPSGYLAYEDAESAIAALQSWGLEVVVGETLGNAWHYFSARDAERRDELQRFMDDPGVQAILMGRGGYGMSRILDQLDFRAFQKKPKWISGFSDITVLHSHLQARYGIASIHGPMCNAFKSCSAFKPHLLSLKQAWFGEAYTLPVHPHPRNRPGIGAGPLLGGNLAILAHLCGSSSQLNTRGAILFIEEVGEYLYNVDRMLITLKRAGMFKDLKGLVVGGFTGLKDTPRPLGTDLYELVLNHVDDPDVPVCFDFPAGHIAVNYALCLGREVRLEVGERAVSVIQ